MMTAKAVALRRVRVLSGSVRGDLLAPAVQFPVRGRALLRDHGGGFSPATVELHRARASGCRDRRPAASFPPTFAGPAPGNRARLRSLPHCGIP
jgi:hypothetical protein